MMEALTALQAVFGVIALVSAGISTLLLGSLKTLRDSNSDLRARVGEVESKNLRLTEEVVILKADRDALERAVRGDDLLNIMVAKLDTHHKDAHHHWEKEEALLHRIVVELGDPS